MSCSILYKNQQWSTKIYLFLMDNIKKTIQMISHNFFCIKQRHMLDYYFHTLPNNLITVSMGFDIYGYLYPAQTNAHTSYIPSAMHKFCQSIVKLLVKHLNLLKFN